MERDNKGVSHEVDIEKTPQETYGGHATPPGGDNDLDPGNVPDQNPGNPSVTQTTTTKIDQP